MDVDRRKRYFGGLLSEEQLTRTEVLEDAIVEELALPIVSYKESEIQDADTWGRIKFE